MPLSQPLSDDAFSALLAPLAPLPDLAVGCSGGPDSLALTLLADAWARARRGRALALVCDHGLRPEGAAEAEAVVALLAARGIPARLLRLHLAGGPRLQERAREARRAALLAACAAEGIAQLLLAQHAGDQGETVLFRALRGSRAAGLSGMWPVTEAAEALILRPLLPVAPARLAATCFARGAMPLLDPSNSDARFARARLRRAPTAAALPAAAAFAARRAREGAEVATRLARAARLYPEGCARLDLARFGGDAVALRALAALLRAVGAAAHAAPPQGVAALLWAGRGTLAGAELTASGWLLRERACLAPPVPAAPGARWDRRWVLRGGVPAGLPPGLWLGALGPPPRALRRLAPDLPAAALAGLPVLRDADGAVALIPHLRWPSTDACGSLALDHVSIAGPACPGEMRAMPVSAPGQAPYLPTTPEFPRHEDQET